MNIHWLSSKWERIFPGLGNGMRKGQGRSRAVLSILEWRHDATLIALEARVAVERIGQT